MRIYADPDAQHWNKVCVFSIPRLYNYYFCLEEYQAQFWKLTATNNELLKQLAEKARFFLH